MTPKQVAAHDLIKVATTSSPLYETLAAAQVQFDHPLSPEPTTDSDAAPPARSGESAPEPDDAEKPRVEGPATRELTAQKVTAHEHNAQDQNALDKANAHVAADSGPWQYPLDLTTAIVVLRQANHATYRCAPQRTFAAATPAWGLSQGDLDAARSLARTKLGTTATGPIDIGGNPHAPGAPGVSDAHANGTAASPDDTADAPNASTSPGPSNRVGELDEDGVAEAFVDLLRHEVVPPVPPFRVLRLVPPPEARGERPIIDQQASSVVVGERVVVTWVRDIIDGPHVVPKTLAHLDAVHFMAVQETHGVLLWTTPTGREVPVAWAGKYLPRARDGWDWCLDLTQAVLGLTPGPARLRDPWQADFPARLGSFAAKLHLALATPSDVLPTPVITAPPDLVRAWHRAAVDRLDAAVAIARAGRLDGVREVVLPRQEALRAAVDRLLLVAERIEAGERVVTTQRIHGDLHVGNLLRWSGGLVVVDFHPNPVVEVDGLAVGQPMQPAARDLARLMRSLDHVGRVVDKTADFTLTEAVDAWSVDARAELLTAYRDELALAHRTDLLDEDLVAAFEAEQLCREIIYAEEFFPSWVYAPLGGVWQNYPAADVNDGSGRHA